MIDFIKYSFLVLVLAGCSTFDYEGDPVSAVSGASFGVPTSRIQFRPTANLMKYSPNVDGFDDVTGATYALTSSDPGNNTLSYTVRGGTATLTVTVEDNDTVYAQPTGGDRVRFTPRANRLGRDPAVAPAR